MAKQFTSRKRRDKVMSRRVRMIGLLVLVGALFTAVTAGYSGWTSGAWHFWTISSPSYSVPPPPANVSNVNVKSNVNNVVTFSDGSNSTSTSCAPSCSLNSGLPFGLEINQNANVSANVNVRQISRNHSSPNPANTWYPAYEIVALPVRHIFCPDGEWCSDHNGTPTPSPTATASPSPTSTPSPTPPPTATPSPTATATPCPSPSPTPTPHGSNHH